MNTHPIDENSIRVFRAMGIAVALCAVLAYAINFSYNEISKSKNSADIQLLQNDNNTNIKDETTINDGIKASNKTNKDEASEISESTETKTSIPAKSDGKTFVEISDSDNPILESIDETNDNGIKTLSQQTYTLENALKYKNSKEYTKALDEYTNVLKNTSDNDVKAICYQEISYIYAINKRYGTELSYAQQAYNLVPNSERELLLARLYYKTGDIDKASKRVNNVLKRDFFIESK